MNNFPRGTQVVYVPTHLLEQVRRVLETNSESDALEKLKGADFTGVEFAFVVHQYPLRIGYFTRNLDGLHTKISVKCSAHNLVIREHSSDVAIKKALIEIGVNELGF